MGLGVVAAFFCLLTVLSIHGEKETKWDRCDPQTIEGEYTCIDVKSQVVTLRRLINKAHDRDINPSDLRLLLAAYKYSSPTKVKYEVLYRYQNKKPDCIARGKVKYSNNGTKFEVLEARHACNYTTTF